MDKAGMPTTPSSQDDAESVARDWLGGRIDESRFWRSMVKSFNAADVASLAALLRQRDACPGHWRCPKCGFYNVRSIINAEAGTVGRDADASRSVCPNDGADMVPVTWREVAESSSEAAEAARTDAREARIAYGKLFSENCANLGFRDDAEAQVIALREALIGDVAAREAVLSLIANLTRDVAPLIAAFRDTPSHLTEELVDTALATMAELQRTEAGFGARFFGRRDVLANTAAAAASLLAREREKEREACGQSEAVFQGYDGDRPRYWETYNAGWTAGVEAMRSAIRARSEP